MLQRDQRATARKAPSEAALQRGDVSSWVSLVAQGADGDGEEPSDAGAGGGGDSLRPAQATRVQVDCESHRCGSYPYCIVATPLPPITW